ncbi:LuxR C-terminal-related transcriptional regulator [Acidisoma sp.]|uniref:LuxR C-terminal-related transcriptional regulator n=1 Tax=Acidisoma sp. TaxID=1872115 RepID=UPI003B008929
MERRPESGSTTGYSEDSDLGALRIAWIDSYALTRDCILRAILELQPTLKVSPFISVAEFVRTGNDGFDLIIFYSHASYDICLQEIAAIRQALEAAPLIMLSDLEDSHQLNTIRGALRAGANGFISTRSTGLAMTLSAIRFVQAGGTFAPLEMLLSDASAPPAGQPVAASPYRLTTRQKAVLAQLQQGKANKIIAHELGMSESTAKVHIRNIMRKMGATNRTQAAFNALKLCSERGEAVAM